ncbi:MAG: hypothetical protein L0170_13360, partial [Acidobacteria bacterium]|nr:hypothetical protein [Acidobacteriota bacterium]
HSPFIVAGREKSQIVRLRRDEETKQIRVEPTYDDTKGRDVTSILTSYLFGLETPVDPDTERDILIRRELVSAETLTDEQKEDLRKLNIKLGGIFVSPTRDPDYNMYLRVMGELHREQAEKGGSAHTGATDEAKLEKAREVLKRARAEREKA